MLHDFCLGSKFYLFELKNSVNIAGEDIATMMLDFQRNELQLLNAVMGQTHECFS